MRILVLAAHYEVTGARYITNALKRLGHDVKHFGTQARLLDAWNVDVAQHYAWIPDALPETWKPDLIIIADTLTTADMIPSHYQDVPAVIWSQDNHVRNSRTQDIGNRIKHYFLAHRFGDGQPVTKADETWLPCAADIHEFKPSQIKWEDRPYDVCLVGVMYPRRAKLVAMLREAGFKVFAATGLIYDQYAAAYQNSRISLCVSSNGDVAQRIFETAAMGCTILTDLLKDLTDGETNQQLGLSGFAVYQDDLNCVQVVKDLLTTDKALAQHGAEVLQKIVREKHTWEHRAQVIIDWYKDNYAKPEPETAVKRPYLNLGCGKTHLPSEKPAGHQLIEDVIYDYPSWVNVDKVEGVGADLTFDLFSYPWPLEDNSYDGALCAHLLEHIPHDIKITDTSERATYLKTLQDGWYAFMSELYRVLTPNAIVHIVSPYGFSDGGITDPSHTRYLTLNTFTHSMTPDISDGSTFKYNNGGINFQVDEEPQYRCSPYAETLMQRTGFPMGVLIGIYNNIVYDFYVRLKAVK